MGGNKGSGPRPFDRWTGVVAAANFEHLNIFHLPEFIVPAIATIVGFHLFPGPHHLRLTADERRLVVSDYFLNEDSFGKVHVGR
jgi:hypothetical protein